VFVACGLGISLANGAESMNFVSVLTMVGVLCCLLTTFQFFFQEDTSFYIPWYEIATSKHVWAISFAHFTNNWGFYTLPHIVAAFLKWCSSLQPTECKRCYGILHWNYLRSACNKIRVSPCCCWLAHCTPIVNASLNQSFGRVLYVLLLYLVPANLHVIDPWQKVKLSAMS